MNIFAKLGLSLIACIHLFIMWFEMFQWTTIGPKIFKTLPPDIFEPTQAMAANQGLYNGFLAAGLIWSLLIKDTLWQRRIALCFLSFVAIAGIYGALTISPTIIYVQTFPAVITAICMIRKID